MHPGHGFAASLGCINPTSGLATDEAAISFGDSRRRVVAMMDDLESFAGETYPHCNGCLVPDASITIEDAAW